MSNLHSIPCFRGIRLRISVYSDKPMITIYGSSQKRQLDVVNHHLPLKRIEKQLVACGVYTIMTVREVLEDLRNRSCSCYQWGGETVLFPLN